MTTPVKKPEPLPTVKPVGVASQLASAPMAYAVECTNVEHLNTAVQILEPTNEKNMDGTPVMGLHACVRTVHVYSFTLRPKKESHPQVAITVHSLSEQGYVKGEHYIVSIQ